MKITSPAFKSNSHLPTQYTCDGNNINPPLTIGEIPAQTISLALIVDDPDAPAGTWVHWLVWNIDPQTTNIDTNSVPDNSIEGTTSFDQPGYDGPCPPSGTHRYFFKIYALDITLNLPVVTNKTELEKAMTDHIIDHAELVGLYSRE
ncbi:MAG: YbhB/YbcL family Raf kinase inhibitor-like protein [Patescibacteria group bacterium]